MRMTIRKLPRMHTSNRDRVGCWPSDVGREGTLKPSEFMSQAMAMNVDMVRRTARGSQYCPAPKRKQPEEPNGNRASSSKRARPTVEDEPSLVTVQQAPPILYRRTGTFTA
jgi:hypothetical protein